MSNEYILRYLKQNENPKLLTNKTELEKLVYKLNYFFCEDNLTCINQISKWLTDYDEYKEMMLFLNQCEVSLGTYDWVLTHKELGVINRDDVLKYFNGNKKLNKIYFDFWWGNFVFYFSEKAWKDLFID